MTPDDTKAQAVRTALRIMGKHCDSCHSCDLSATVVHSVVHYWCYHFGSSVVAMRPACQFYQPRRKETRER